MRRVLRHFLQIAGVSTVALVLYFVLPLDRFGPLFSLLLLIGLLVAMGPMTLRHARKVAESSTPMIEAAEALLTLLSALVIGFATIHYSLAHQVDEQFSGSTPRSTGSTSPPRCCPRWGSATSPRSGRPPG